MDEWSIFRSVRKELVGRNVDILTLNGPGDDEGLERIRRTVWASDRHVIMDGMMPHELRRLYPVFKERGNFSMSMVDWWTSRHWFTRHARFLIFRNYNGIAVRRGLGVFAAGRRPPLLAPPANSARFSIASSLLRGPALLAAPFLALWNKRLRALEKIPLNRLLYYPFSITEEHLPGKPEAPVYDFCSVGATGGYWFMRDPHASPVLNFGNLYCDRLRLADLLSRANGGRYKLFDLRRSKFLNGEEYRRVIHGSRYAVATGGLHQNSVAKYMEFACLGTPMIGEDLPFEYPWLSDCLYPIDIANVTAEKLDMQLSEAIELQPKLRQNCLNVRSSLLKLYHPGRVLDLLQDQADGKPIPPEYLKSSARN